MCGILIKLFASLRKSIHRPKLTTTRALENESFLGNFTAKAKSDVPSPFGSLQHKIPIQEHSLCRVILHIRSFLCLTRREINKSEKKLFVNLFCKVEKEIVAVPQKFACEWRDTAMELGEWKNFSNYSSPNYVRPPKPLILFPLLWISTLPGAFGTLSRSRSLSLVIFYVLLGFVSIKRPAVHNKP